MGSTEDFKNTLRKFIVNFLYIKNLLGKSPLNELAKCMSLKIWLLNFVWKSWCNVWYGYSKAELTSEFHSYSPSFLVGKIINKYPGLFDLLSSIWAFEALPAIHPKLLLIGYLSLKKKKLTIIYSENQHMFLKATLFIHFIDSYESVHCDLEHEKCQALLP